MENLLHYTAVILIIIWSIGFFAMEAGLFNHILLVIALIAVYLAIVQRKKEFD